MADHPAPDLLAPDLLAPDLLASASSGEVVALARGYEEARAAADLLFAIAPRTLAEAVEDVRSGEVTSTSLVREAFRRADQVDERLHALKSRLTDQAKRAAAAVTFGDDLGPLGGVPIAVKDILKIADGHTTAGSAILDWPPDGTDAVVVERLRNAGAVILATTTTMEFAIGPPDGKRAPITRNPWNLSRFSGGSSCGSAAAVAAGIVPAALGTDTAGSIRAPAAYCGITGLKPTYGLVPRSGCVPLSPSLDTIGPMARSALDCALLLEVIAAEPVAHHLDGDLTGLTIGVDRLFRVAGEQEDPALPSVLHDAVEVLRSRGAHVVDVELPYYDELAIALTVVLHYEAFAYHQADLRRRWHDYGATTRLALACGSRYTEADYAQAQRVRRFGRRAVARIFDEVDVVLTPTSVEGAISLRFLEELDPTQGLGTAYTPYWSALGNPAASMPSGFTADGMPLGLQVAGRPSGDGVVLKVVDAFQRATDWHLRVPQAADHRGA
ncbi:amidase [Herbidospora sp. RD11066]